MRSECRVETGALAMFDALGIRGIWLKHDPDDVVQKLEKIALSARDLVEREFGGPGYPNTRDPWNVAKTIRLGFVSDTIVVGFVTKDERDPAFAVMMAARYATEIALLGLELSAAHFWRRSRTGSARPALSRLPRRRVTEDGRGVCAGVVAGHNSSRRRTDRRRIQSGAQDADVRRVRQTQDLG
jgi:hypothetical protein